MMLPMVWVVIGGIIALMLPEKRPRQLALAVALGAVLGLIPKDNILAGFLVLLIFLLRVNLGVGIMTAGLFTWVGVFLEPYAEKLGSFLLHRPFLQSQANSFFELPLVAWTSLNNTIVLGEFLFGLFLFWPIYKVFFMIFKAFLPAGDDSQTVSTPSEGIKHAE